MANKKRPSIKQLEQEVAAFNRRFNVGDPVEYMEVIDSGNSQRFTTRSEAQILSGHSAVVWLNGKSGCVACSHCFMPPGVGG
jgi:hypothetical protein